MADVNTGDRAVLRMEAWVTGTDVNGNNNAFHWRLSLIERNSGTSGWQASSIPASVEVLWDGGGYHVPWSGSFTYDFRAGGQQSVVIAEGDLGGMGNFADGSPRTFTFRGNIGNTGTSTAGGPASVDQAVAGNPTRRVPNAPTNVQASAPGTDGKTTLTWNQSNPSNGQPHSNQVYVSLNNGGWFKLLDIQATNSVVIGLEDNAKVQFAVAAWNPAGGSAWGASQPIVYTNPGAPTGLSATKNASQDIVLAWANNMRYSEYQTEVWHGVVVGGVTTWDAAPLATVSSGTTSYTHVSPNASQVHVYRVRSRAGSVPLYSSYAVSNVVQLLVAPNKPTFGQVPQYADRAVALEIPWAHNSVDSTPQSAYEFSYSTNGGTSWTTTGKVASTVSKRTIAANAYAANTALTMRVRTWGQATSGGSDGTGASPWSDLSVVTFKTAPTVTITSPANGSTVNDATLRTNLAFAQAQGATFVKAQLELLRGGSLLETLDSTTLMGTTFTTPVENATSYTVRARVQDSNGLWSAWASNTFSVTYLAPVPAVVKLSYLEDKGWGQIELSIPAPGAGQSAVNVVTVTRRINGGPEEVIVENYPYSPTLVFLDTVPTIHGTNVYTVKTFSALGAQSSVTGQLVTNECRRAFLSKGPGYNLVGAFGGNLSIDESVAVASTTVEAAGRVKPIGLYGVETSVQLKVKSFVYEGFGSTLDELRAILLVPGKACYRDATGRRLFGVAKGSISREKVARGDFAFTMTETS